MSRKLLFEDIKNKFEERNFELLETEYIGPTTKMKFCCRKHKNIELFMSYNFFRDWRGCGRCQGLKNIRLTFEEVREEFRKKGYTLLETEYINCNTPMRFFCNAHPNLELFVSYNNFIHGTGCSRCLGKKYIKPTFQEVKALFIERNYELLETEYINNDTPMHYICPNHQEKNLTVTMHEFKNGRGCIYCARDNLRFLYEDVSKAFTDRGYELLSTEYINSNTPLQYHCPFHPDAILSITVSNLLNGSGCRLCFIDRNHGETSNNWKGGVSYIGNYIRTAINKEWRDEKFKESNYTCALSGLQGTVNVHHLQPFSEIINQVLSELKIPLRPTVAEYTETELFKITEKAIELHQTVEGIVLSKKVHKLFHHLYGIKDTTPDDFYEFAERWRSGEFENSMI